MAQGGKLEIFCNANGPTDSSVEWIPPHSANSNVQFSANSAVYRKENVGLNDSGMYVCRVNSGNETKQKEARVQIVPRDIAHRTNY